MVLRVGLETVWQMDRRGRSQKQNHLPSILRRCRQTSYAGDMLVSCKEHAFYVNQGGTADSVCIIRP